MKLTERYSEKLDLLGGGENLDGILLQLEVTNVCNHKCIFCPNAESTRKKKMMDLGLAERVIKECADFLGEDKRICFHMNGEPLLYKGLPGLVKYSKALGYEYAFITTNGSTANENLLIELFEAGLDSIKFSINAGTKETYARVHGADDFEKAITALKFAWKYRNETKRNFKIYVSCVGTKENYQELVEFDSLIKPYCDEVVFYYPCTYAGQKIDKTQELSCDLSKLPIKTFEIKHTVPCAVLWNSINVTCEGYLSLCCSEADNRLIIEDINHKSVKEAWLGERMAAIRKGHQKGEIKTMPCYSCITQQPYHLWEMDEELFELALKESLGKEHIPCV